MNEKRRSKPLPVIQEYALDDSSRQHISNLLKRWLLNEKVPLEPWFNVLYNIAITISEKTFASSESISTQKICIQTISASSPADSKFLQNVYHGNKDKIEKSEEQLPVWDFPIGGTIRIYGSSEPMTSKLVDIVSAMIYVIQSLCLEYFLMRDHHVKLIHEQKAKPLLTLPTTDTPHQKVSIKHGILSWLTGSSQKKRTDTSKKTIPEKNTHSILKRGLSFGNITKKFDSDKPISSFDYDQVIENHDPYRFSKLKKRIELALVSSSPDCYFPYPTLLNRLDLEEQLILEQRRIYYAEMHQSKLDSNTTLTPPKPRRSSTLLSSINPTHFKRHSYNADDHKNNNNNNNSTPSPSDEELNSVVLPQFITAYSSFRSNELLSDGRFGLEHFLLDTFTLKGFKQHQSITVGVTCYPIGCPERPCFGPIMSKMDYYRFKDEKETIQGTCTLDQTLGSVIRNWCERSRSSCQSLIEENKIPILSSMDGQTPLTERPGLIHSHSRKSNASLNSQSSTPGLNKKLDSNRQCSIHHACHQLLTDHVFCITHGTGKFNVYINSFQIDEEKAAQQPDVIDSWLTCNKCDASTTPQKLHVFTEQFSFGKFLELIFYSTRFSTLHRPICQHKTKQDLIRCFRLNRKGVVIKFVYEEIKTFELRIPRIQVGYVKKDLHENEPRMNPAIQKEWKKAVVQDVELFFQCVATHLDVLSRYISADGKRKCRDLPQDTIKYYQAELDVIEKETNGLRKRLEQDQKGLMSALAKTDLNELNDFRRYFAIQSNSLLECISDWQKKSCVEVIDDCHWDKPDYIESKNIHSFPGSSILVREDEPTSIIAYTLSSNDYLQEIFSGEGPHLKKGENEAILATSHKRSRSVPSLISNNSDSEESSDSNATVKSQILDGYYSAIERKYISSSTGSSTETASFRTMLVEVCKTSVSEAHTNSTRRVESLKSKLSIHSSWIKKQEEAKVENRGLKREFSERDLEPLSALKKESDNASIATKEYTATSYYQPTNNNKSNGDDKKISPHINYKFAHDTTEFTCVVYYAKEFEQLRKQCDINQLIIESLSRCDTWHASGGKSKSQFYKTKDNRFVVKQMVNAWNIAEKDAFLKFGPKYFEHMKQSSNAPSVLAKIFGFFTIQMRNTVDKKETLNMDVLIMEHLFYGHHIIKRFDFKGIQDRHVEESHKQQKEVTLWDGDWLDEYRMHLPVNEESKAMIQAAIHNDTEFLSKSNIMDYSLLVGIDEDKGEMTVGVVDFIGAYTWYKKIESKSKSTLRSSRKEVTVLPPDQYKERFDREVCDYFIPIPGKFDHVELDQTMPSLLNYSNDFQYC